MATLSFFFILILFHYRPVETTFSAVNKASITGVQEFISIDYTWDATRVKQDYISSQKFIPENCLLSGLQLDLAGVVYVTVPRWKPGVPATLNILRNDGYLQPYPSWDMQREGVAGDLQSAQSIHISLSAKQMWVVESGRRNVLMPNIESHVAGAAGILIIDMLTSIIVSSYSFPDNVVSSTAGFLSHIAVDDARQIAYLSDANGGLVIYDKQKASSKRYAGSSTARDPLVELVVNGINYGINFHRPAAITGLALSTDTSFLYFCSLQGTRLYRIPTSVLRDFTLSTAELESFIAFVGDKPSSDGMIIWDTVLYYGSLLDSTYYALPAAPIDTTPVRPTDPTPIPTIAPFANPTVRPIVSTMSPISTPTFPPNTLQPNNAPTLEPIDAPVSFIANERLLKANLMADTAAPTPIPSLYQVPELRQPTVTNLDETKNAQPVWPDNMNMHWIHTFALDPTNKSNLWYLSNAFEQFMLGTMDISNNSSINMRIIITAKTTFPIPLSSSCPIVTDPVVCNWRDNDVIAIISSISVFSGVCIIILFLYILVLKAWLHDQDDLAALRGREQALMKKRLEKAGYAGDHEENGPVSKKSFAVPLQDMTTIQMSANDNRKGIKGLSYSPLGSSRKRPDSYDETTYSPSAIHRKRFSFGEDEVAEITSSNKTGAYSFSEDSKIISSSGLSHSLSSDTSIRLQKFGFLSSTQTTKFQPSSKQKSKGEVFTIRGNVTEV